MTSPLRKSGLDPVGGLPWGAHFCHFFETEADLLDTLCAYFRAGVEDGELGLWIVGDPIARKAAEKVRRGLAPPLHLYLAEGRLEIQLASEWDLHADALSFAQLLQRWDEKLAWALGHGFSGLRVDGAWVGNSPWRDFMAHEKRLAEGIVGKPIIVLCSYPLAGSGAMDVLDAAQVHEVALAKRSGRWEVLETSELREAKEEIRRLNEQLQARVDERTAELEAANDALRARHRRQSAVAALGQIAIRSRDLDAVLDEATKAVAATLETPFSSVLEHVDGEQLLLRAGVGWPCALEGARFGSHGPGGYVVRTDAPVVVADVEQDSRFANLQLFTDHSIRSLMAVAIRSRQRPWGTLATHSTTPRAFSDDDVEFLQSVANVVALAIERCEAELAEEREKEVLQAIFDNIPVMISFYGPSGRLLRVNREWERVTGRTLAETPDTGFLAEIYTDPQQLEAVLDFIRRAERTWRDFRSQTRDGRWLDTSWAHFLLSDGSRIGFGLDITERKRAEAALAESQARFSKVFHVSPVALAISTIDEGRIIDVNQAWLDLFGYERAEVIGRNGPDLDLLVDPGISEERVAPLIPEGVVHSLEFQVRRKSREVRDIIASAARTEFAGGQAWIAALIDITERKRAEAERDRLLARLEGARLRLEQLSRRLFTAQEEERRRLAVELHDQLGQVLTAIKIQVESAQRAASREVSSQLAAAVASVEGALQTVHDLALDLRPSVLDDLGLPAALRWLADRFARDVRLQVHVAVHVEEELPLDRDMQTASFRIAQEALTNVARHARAKNVWIELHRQNGELMLSVRDDGVGFDAAAATRRAVGGSSLGLLGMEERASLLGGSFEVASSAEGGTEVRARFPLDGRHGDRG